MTPKFKVGDIVHLKNYPNSIYTIIGLVDMNEFGYNPVNNVGYRLRKLKENCIGWDLESSLELHVIPNKEDLITKKIKYLEEKFKNRKVKKERDCYPHIFVRSLYSWTTISEDY